MKRAFLGLIFLFPICMCAQLPQTKLYVFDIKQLSDTTIIVDYPRYLSDMNREGYNNQPVFINKDEYLLTVGQAGDAQPDIFKFNLTTNEYQQITSTSSGEYSPGLSPNGGYYRCVRLTANGNQNIWEYPIDASNGGKSRFRFTKNVGYFANIMDTKVYAFLTGEPHQMAILDETDDSKYVFTANVGRTLRIYNNELYFIHKMSEGSWYLKKFNPKTKKSTIVVKMPSTIEDFEILENGAVIIGQGSLLKIYNRAIKGQWKTIADLSKWAIKNITRLHVGFGKILLVDKVAP